MLTTGAPAPFLFALRNECLAADLDEMIAHRETRLLERFKFTAEIKPAMKKAIPNIIGRLQRLQTLALRRFSQIDEKYKENETDTNKKRKDQPEWPVVTQSETTLSYSDSYREITNSKTESRPVATLTRAYYGTLPHDSDPKKEDELAKERALLHHNIKNTIMTQMYDEVTSRKLAVTQVSECPISIPYLRQDSEWKELPEAQDLFHSQNIEAIEGREGEQIYTTPNQSYFQPRLDNEVSHEQLQIGLINDEMERTIFSFRIDSHGQDHRKRTRGF